MTFLNWIGTNFWSILLGLIFIDMVFGESIHNAFYAIVGLGNRRGLTRRQQKRLRVELDRTRQQLREATDILREVHTNDTVFPQLGTDVSDKVKNFVDQHQANAVEKVEH